MTGPREQSATNTTPTSDGTPALAREHTVLGTMAVIVNYNGADILPACVESLVALNIPGLTVLVVDNASTDDVRSYLPTHKSVELLQLPENTGFAGGARAGVDYALRDPEVAAIAVLNNDLGFDHGIEELLVGVSQNRWSPGLYAPALVNQDGSIQNMGQVWSRWTGIVTTCRSPTGTPDEDGVCWIGRNQFLCGAAIVGSPSVFRRVNFDPQLFLLCEDLDLCMQAHAAGIPMGVAVNCKVVHGGGVTFRKNAGVSAYYHWRNGPLMTARYGSIAEFWVRLAVLPVQLIHHVLAALHNRDFPSLFACLRGARIGTRLAFACRFGDADGENLHPTDPS